jgi:UDP-2,3-diacylglucosamine hydrolase
VTTLFISDLHIDASRPDITARFLKFAATELPCATALYILGDLFETWVGDEDPDPDQQSVIRALRSCTDSGVPCFVMHGNRDFLLGQRFCDVAGAQLLPDPIVLTLYGTPVLVMHGDALCTDDRSYQRLRATVRNPDWQRRFLALTLRQRRTIAQAARAGSQAHMAGLAYSIVDVNPASVEIAFRGARTDVLLHGHTHRPGVHSLTVDGRECTRIVLGDWYEQGSVLRWDHTGFELGALAA